MALQHRHAFHGTAWEGRTESGPPARPFSGYADWPLLRPPHRPRGQRSKPLMVTVGALVHSARPLTFGIFVTVFTPGGRGIDSRAGRKRLYAAYFMLSESSSYFSARSKSCSRTLGDPPLSSAWRRMSEPAFSSIAAQLGSPARRYHQTYPLNARYPDGPPQAPSRTHPARFLPALPQPSSRKANRRLGASPGASNWSR